tara:strand:+ start:392 stop:1003 length:612 start_codon:yes stop_codon:yes gene_type:complete
MASLWQFFGLPNPENPSVDKKGKKANSAPPSMQKQPSMSQEEDPKAIEIEETTPLAIANEEPSQSQSGLLARSVMKSAPPLWKGPLTAENEPFHDLGSHTKMKSPFPRRALRYVSPDEMNRIPTRDMAKRIHQGDSIIVDLRPMVHMDTHQNVCRRELRQMGNDTGIGVFALDAEDKLLLLPGKDVVVDVGRHELGLQSLLSE